MNEFCERPENIKILTGDFVGSAWNTSPFWTPYASAIAASYPVQVPWFYSIPIETAQGVDSLHPQFRERQTRPQLWDVLIMGAAVSADFNDWFNGVLVNHLSIQISHQETGIPWVDPTTVGYAPILSIAGLSVTEPLNTVFYPRMPIMRFPDAFFYPKNTILEFRWTQFTSQPLPPVKVILTLIGVQLVRNGPAPETVGMPDGSIIKVGSRQPWYGVVPYGRRGNTGRIFGDISLAAGEQYMQFLPPADCDVELHDVYANFTAGYPGSQNYTAKIQNLRAPADWTPGFSPSMAISGDELKRHPALPFPRPYLIEFGHRLGVVEQNNALVDTPIGSTLTFRGVRRCQY